MKIYLDNCCFNRPFDEQSWIRIMLETEAKLRIQEEVSPTFAIRIEKQSFSGIHRLETLDFTGVDFQNGL